MRLERDPDVEGPTMADDLVAILTSDGGLPGLTWGSMSPSHPTPAQQVAPPIGRSTCARSRKRVTAVTCREGSCSR